MTTKRYRCLATGGKVRRKGISDSQYYSIMERVAKNNNSEWNRLRRKEGMPILSEDEELVRVLNDNTYNYRGYYDKYPNGQGNALDHWTDEFKTVYHPTFSVESRYSGKDSQYNPYGRIGGRWNGDNFIPAPWQRNKYETGGKGTKRNIQLSDIALPLLGGVGGLVLSNDAIKLRLSRTLMNAAHDSMGDSLSDVITSLPKNVINYIINDEKDSPAQDTYFTPRYVQDREFLNRGYIRGAKGDYGLVKQAVGNKNIPVYQRNPDHPDADRANLVPIYNGYDITGPNIGVGNLPKTMLEHAGSYPYTIYVDGRSGKTNNYYKKAWDLNDYGDAAGGDGAYYFGAQPLANLLDIIGSPTVVTTGYQETESAGDRLNDFLRKKGLHLEWDGSAKVPMTNDVIITGKRKSKEKGGSGIHIDPANKGKFTATMKRTGKTAEELSHSSNPLTRKRAIFMLNAKKWNH